MGIDVMPACILFLSLKETINWETDLGCSFPVFFIALFDLSRGLVVVFRATWGSTRCAADKIVAGVAVRNRLLVV